MKKLLFFILILFSSNAFSQADFLLMSDDSDCNKVLGMPKTCAFPTPCEREATRIGVKLPEEYYVLKNAQEKFDFCVAAVNKKTEETAHSNEMKKQNKDKKFWQIFRFAFFPHTMIFF